MTALAAALLALAQIPSYPLPLAEPAFTGAGRPFELADLQYALSDTFSTDHAFLARVRVRDRAFLGAAFRGEQRTLTVQAARLELAAHSRDGQHGLSALFRTRRLLLGADADRITAPGAQGWVLRPSVSVRLSPDFELLGSVRGDTRRNPFLRTASAGFLWQRGVRWEAFGEYEHARERTEARAENVRDSGVLALVAQVGAAELSGGLRVDDTRGRFPRRQAEPDAGLRLKLTSRLLLEGGARTRLEGGHQLSHHYDGAISWFGRRFVLPREGAAAQRSLALARRATEMGYNERRVFDDDSRRAQRERLSLRSGRDALLPDMLEQYLAQVEERPLPVLRFELVDEEDALSATQTRIARALLGVPWPLAWPWRAHEGSVPFLQLDLERRRLLSGPAFRSLSHGLALSVSLNREMDLRVSHVRAEPSPLDLIRGIGRHRTFEVSFVYARGR